jgi:hypothetical protein
MNQIGRTSLGSLAVLVAALLACDPDNSALDYARLGIVASDASGSPVSASAGSACVTLPVLRGSQVDKSFDVSDTLSVEVSADRSGLVVHFAHATPPVSDKHLSREQLEGTYFQEVQVSDQAGQAYLVQLSSECDPSAAQ